MHSGAKRQPGFDSPSTETLWVLVNPCGTGGRLPNEEKIEDMAASLLAKMRQKSARAPAAAETFGFETSA